MLDAAHGVRLGANHIAPVAAGVFELGVRFERVGVLLVHGSRCSKHTDDVFEPAHAAVELQGLARAGVLVLLVGVGCEADGDVAVGGDKGQKRLAVGLAHDDVVVTHFRVGDGVRRSCGTVAAEHVGVGVEDELDDEAAQHRDGEQLAAIEQAGDDVKAKHLLDRSHRARVHVVHFGAVALDARLRTAPSASRPPRRSEPGPFSGSSCLWVVLCRCVGVCLSHGRSRSRIRGRGRGWILKLLARNEAAAVAEQQAVRRTDVEGLASDSVEYEEELTKILAPKMCRSINFV